MNQPPPLPVSAPMPWGTLGALVGAVVVGAAAGSMLFPREHIVEKPIEVTVEKRVEVPVEKIVEKQVDRIVEKPVEVVRTVEKRVEVPAKLTKEQEVATAVFAAILDAEEREFGYQATGLYPAKDKKIKVYVIGDTQTFRKVDKAEISARVESVFRRDGFTIVPQDGEYCETVVLANVDLMLSDNGIKLSGSLAVDIRQNIMGLAGGVWKRSNLQAAHYGTVIDYGSNHFDEIPAIYERLAIKASSDLLKAGPTNYKNPKTK